MTDWLAIAWGKFRGWQRVCAAPQRLDRAQLRAAWQVWDLMRKTKQAADQGEDEWAELIHAQTVQLTKEMPAKLRRGPAIFSHWLVENKARLSRPVERAVAERAHTTDRVSAQLIR